MIAMWPSLYNVVMSPKVCSSLMLGSYLMALSGVMARTGCMLRLTFCDANTINHYFCDVNPLLQLSCTSTYINELVLFIVVTSITLCPVSPSLSLMVSFSPASSTLAPRRAGPNPSVPAVPSSLLFLCPLDHVHLCISGHLLLGLWTSKKFSSVFYMNVVAMMNPLIYSLRNKVVKTALRKTLSRR